MTSIAPGSPEDLAQALKDAAAGGKSISIIGNNSKRLMSGPVLPADIILTTQKLRQQFQQLDTNHDGQLSFAEFSAVIGNIRSAQTPDQKLQQLDTNHDGKISAAEYRAPELARFNKVDANHDGVITQAEIDAANHK